MTDEGIEARIRRLEDVEEIRRLKVRYFDACDGGFADHTSHVPEEIAACFADDGAWDGGPYGTRTGPAAIADFYRDKAHGLAFTVLSEPTVDVDGDRATGRWNVVVYSEFAPSGSVLVGGILFNHTAFLEGIYANGGGDSFDGVAIHPYTIDRAPGDTT